jgi:predicted enzyme related to lactoylglutathione lyase
VLQFRHVDVGHGWLIFALPESEVAVHPSDENDKHEFFLMCDDVEAAIAKLEAAGTACEPITDQPWGRLTFLRLPGGGKLGLYQARHPRP